MLAFVQALDADYRTEGIRANAILPSVIDTPANRAGEPDADHSRWVPPGDRAGGALPGLRRLAVTSGAGSRLRPGVVLERALAELPVTLPFWIAPIGAPMNGIRLPA